VPVDALSAAGGRSPGFFGKLPSRGDFVTRRLPQEFVARWDGWLQDAIAASRAELAAGWLDVYLTSPVWRFALAPGVCGPQGWIGVMIPSVDKVGRYFPLAASFGVESRVSPLAAAAELDEWFAEVEELLLATLAETPLDLDVFDERLARLVPSPSESTAGPGVYARGTDAWHFTVPNGRLGDALGVLGADALTHAGWRSVWWSQGSERIEPCVLLAPGLPEPRAFVAMLDGGWAERGWRHGTLSDRLDPATPTAAYRREPATGGSVLAVRSAGITDVGKVREINEDAWACRDDLGVWLVADGLGGHQAGEVASRMVVAALEACAVAEPRADAVEQLAGGLRVANRCLRVLAERGANIRLAASTVAALVVDERGASCVWAGDSRVYRLRDGRLEQLSADHSEAANGAFDSRAVTRAVGGADVLELGVARSDVRAGDRFLLCTDGLYGEVDAGTIADALMLPEPELGCAKLRDAALAGDARDNLTAVVVHVGAGSAR